MNDSGGTSYRLCRSWPLNRKFEQINFFCKKSKNNRKKFWKLKNNAYICTRVRI